MSAAGNAHYIVIDDLGAEHAWPWSPIFRQFDGLGADCDTLAYIVRNLGFILIIDRPDFLRLRLRPLLVSTRSVAALFYWLAERRPARSAITWYDEGWHDEVCGSPRQLRNRLGAILQGGSGLPSERYLATRRHMDTVLDTPGHPFAPLLKAWLRGSREELLASAKQQGLWQRAMVAERDPERGGFRFRHSGGSIQLYGAEWSGQAAGRLIREQPDSEYGMWIEQGCAAVDDMRTARVELVHAAVTGTDGQLRRWRYERLMLPFESADGDRIVMSISTRDPGPGR